jgi:hypothetical protein
LPSVNVTLAVASVPDDGASVETLIETARGRIGQDLPKPGERHQPPRSVH